MLVKLFVSANKATLDENNITLTTDHLTFTDVKGGEFESADGSYNTQALVTAKHPKVSGSQTYIYNRLDILDEFESQGVTAPEVEISGEVTKQKFLDAFDDTYGIRLLDSEVLEFTSTDGTVTFTVAEGSLSWTGDMVIATVDTVPELSTILTNRQLNGFEPL